MILKDFSEERGVNHHAVWTYIRRHPELFDEHTKLNGKNMVLDDEAIAILDKKYPLPKPVEVIVDTESMKKLLLEKEKTELLENHIRALQDEIAELKADVLELNQEKLMIEEKSEAKEQELTSLREQYGELEARSAEKIADLSAKLEAERNKKWHQKLFESIKKAGR